MITTRNRAFNTVATMLALAAAALLSGCITARDKQAQLERVAKDWCMTIRASQVLPVYPLTEDLQPGDLFLTTTYVGDEARLFTEKGFLPLDNHLARLGAGAEFAEFYINRNLQNPESGKFPTPGAWSSMPHAAFPTYSVEITRSGGLNLAVPVQGVPVGLNILGAAAATATVTIADAYSYGLDLDSLDPLVDRWAEKNAKFLAPYATKLGDSNAVFVRAVSRVYYTGEVNIQLSDASSSGVEAKAGVNLALPDAAITSTSTAAEMYSDITQKLNAPLLTTMGGRVRLINVSSRGVAMEETFPAPLVIGYIAYDRQVLPGGKLGPAVSTFNRVSGVPQVSPTAAAAGSLGGSRHSQAITTWYQADRATRVPQIRAWMDANGFADADAVAFLNGANFEPQHERMMRDLGIPNP